MRLQVLWYAALSAGILALTGYTSLAHAATDVGQPAPALVVTELDGQAFDLAALRGKVVIVSFWATWDDRIGGLDRSEFVNFQDDRS